ncbi:MAG: alpha-galactosidase [Pseudomonadota bacterium]
MSIVQAHRLDAAGQTLVLASLDLRLPFIAYWGAGLPDGEDLSLLAENTVRPTGPAMLSRPIEVSICPEDGRAFPGEPGLRGSRGDGADWMTQFRLEDFIRFDDQTLHVLATDSGAGLTYRATVTVAKVTGVVELASEIENNRESPFQLHWLSAPVLRLPSWATHMQSYSGRWCGEFRKEAREIVRGAMSTASFEGRTSHEASPFALFCEAGTSKLIGRAIATHLGSSAGHRLTVERLTNGETQVQMGEMLRPGEVMLQSGEIYRTPTFFLAQSDIGEAALSLQLHNHVRTSILPTSKNDPVKPVHYNCWEAIYFDHSESEIRDLIQRVAALGVERFVLDDGWFANRADDTSGLGDWRVDPKKYPNGLLPIIEAVLEAGMGFGLWVEPEMVSRDSELYEQHPEWCLGPPSPAHDQILGRSQLVLDLSLPEVRDDLFGKLSNLLAETPIEYLKWDHNRPLAVAGGLQGRAAYAKQASGLRQLLERLRRAFPAVDVESCASGGARIDYAILQHCNRVWLSDSNDARERWRMQREALTFLPPEIIGSHVGPRICHTSGRVLPMAFRAGVAAMRHMGLEMDPRELDEDETLILQDMIAWHKANRDFLHSEQTFVLDTNSSALEAEMTVASDASRFILFIAQLEQPAEQALPPVRLAALDSDARYRLKAVQPVEIEKAVNRLANERIFQTNGVRLSGAFAMNHGIQLPNAFPDALWIIEGQPL